MPENQKSMTEQREDALLQNELNNLQEYGDEYWDSGTGLFGKLGMSFGSSGKGERLFHELNKLGLKSEKENYAFINQELKNAGLDYQLSSELLEEEREKRQEGERVQYAEGTAEKIGTAYTVGRAIGGDPTAIVSLLVKADKKVKANKEKYPDMTVMERRAAIKKAKKDAKKAGTGGAKDWAKEDTDLSAPWIIDPEAQDPVRKGMQEG